MNTNKMKCELQISSWCTKRIRKGKEAMINGKNCCSYCYNWQRRLNERKRKEKLKTNERR